MKKALDPFPENDRRSDDEGEPDFDGFMNELSKIVLDQKPTYERMADEPEWSSRQWVFVSDIVGAFANWACRLSPYACPDGLETVLKTLNSELERQFLNMAKVRDDETEDLSIASLSLCEINFILHHILMGKGVGSFDSWGIPKKDKEEPMCSDGNFDPDYDWIDLEALLHNVCLDIRTQWRDEYGDFHFCGEDNEKAMDEKCGVPFYRYVPEFDTMGEGKVFRRGEWPLDENGDPVYHKKLMKMNDLVDGMKVVFLETGEDMYDVGFVKGNPDTHAYLECRGGKYELRFAEDDRECWVCMGKATC